MTLRGNSSILTSLLRNKLRGLKGGCLLCFAPSFDPKRDGSDILLKLQQLSSSYLQPMEEVLRSAE